MVGSILSFSLPASGAHFNPSQRNFGWRIGEYSAWDQMKFGGISLDAMTEDCPQKKNRRILVFQWWLQKKILDGAKVGPQIFLWGQAGQKNLAPTGPFAASVLFKVNTEEKLTAHIDSISSYCFLDIFSKTLISIFRKKKGGGEKLGPCP